MPDDQQRPSFWTTLPGILTGIASLITALAGAVALFMHRGPEPESPPAKQTQSSLQLPSSSQSPSSGVAAATSLPPDDPAQDAAACQQIAGEWTWSTGGVVTIGSDGGLQWRANPGDARPAVVGRSVCTDSVRREFLFTWSHGFSDVFALSEDAQRVSGVNQQTQTRLFGNRR